jgi:hypothetical protein
MGRMLTPSTEDQISCISRLAYLEDGAVRLVSRKGNVYKPFPALCQSLGACVSASDAGRQSRRSTLL